MFVRERRPRYPVLWTMIVLMCGALLGVAGYMAWNLINGP